MISSYCVLFLLNSCNSNAHSNGFASVCVKSQNMYVSKLFSSQITIHNNWFGAVYSYKPKSDL